ncbi:hypothetical protein SAMN04488113_12717 [Alkalibacterium gilvum]|uniref:Uncharacterized protein n=1 Tax=Alkalibacterium gilvum TaxID=1130080 RepID=A0A1H6UGI0_9LACT|nr:hypothetical protein [Alkalibacterium gilvum]SEI86902.1 hypothetical protein SAMN04488113_12717 [Alkalibacterium gilvum]
MKNIKYFDEIVLSFILIGSVISLFIFTNNISSITAILLGDIESTMSLNIMSFFTISTTLASIIRVNHTKSSWLWFIPIFTLSFIGTFIYALINFYNKFKKFKEDDKGCAMNAES